MTTITNLARRLRRLEQRHGSALGDAADWLTHAEEQTIAGLRNEPTIPGEIRELAAEAIHLVASARRNAGLPPPRLASAGGLPPPPSEVIELLDRAKRELGLVANVGPSA